MSSPLCSPYQCFFFRFPFFLFTWLYNINFLFIVLSLIVNHVQLCLVYLLSNVCHVLQTNTGLKHMQYKSYSKPCIYGQV